MPLPQLAAGTSVRPGYSEDIVVRASLTTKYEVSLRSDLPKFAADPKPGYDCSQPNERGGSTSVPWSVPSRSL
jgi:hypothetical protein